MRKKQCGAILVISLIILFSLTLLVLSGNKSVVMQEKMTMAVRDAHVSLEISESGIRDAEKIIETLVGTSAFNAQGVGGRYSQDTGPADIFAANIWVSNKTSEATTPLKGQTANYFIEHLGLLPVPDAESSSINVTGYGETAGGGNVHGFKIVSRSLGDKGDAERIVVSYYGKRF